MAAAAEAGATAAAAAGAAAAAAGPPRAQQHQLSYNAPAFTPKPKATATTPAAAAATAPTPAAAPVESQRERETRLAEFPSLAAGISSAVAGATVGTAVKQKEKASAQDRYNQYTMARQLSFEAGQLTAVAGGSSVVVGAAAKAEEQAAAQERYNQYAMGKQLASAAAAPTPAPAPVETQRQREARLAEFPSFAAGETSAEAKDRYTMARQLSAVAGELTAVAAAAAADFESAAAVEPAETTSVAPSGKASGKRAMGKRAMGKHSGPVAGKSKVKAVAEAVAVAAAKASAMVVPDTLCGPYSEHTNSEELKAAAAVVPAQTKSKQSGSQAGAKVAGAGAKAGGAGAVVQVCKFGMKCRRKACYLTHAAVGAAAGAVDKGIRGRGRGLTAGAVPKAGEAAGAAARAGKTSAELFEARELARKGGAGAVADRFTVGKQSAVLAVAAAVVLDAAKATAAAAVVDAAKGPADVKAEARGSPSAAVTRRLPGHTMSKQLGLKASPSSSARGCGWGPGPAGGPDAAGSAAGVSKEVDEVPVKPVGFDPLKAAQFLKSRMDAATLPVTTRQGQTPPPDCLLTAC